MLLVLSFLSSVLKSYYITRYSRYCCLSDSQIYIKFKNNYCKQLEQ
jgi:hypothetical protein